MLIILLLELVGRIVGGRWCTVVGRIGGGRWCTVGESGRLVIGGSFLVFSELTVDL